MNVVEIENTIAELESGNTTYDSCSKLASLYIVREHMTTDKVVEEYSDILPEYNKYKYVKSQYQMNRVDNLAVLESAKLVFKELKEFLLILYSNTDLQEERVILKGILSDVLNSIHS